MMYVPCLAVELPKGRRWHHQAFITSVHRSRTSPVTCDPSNLRRASMILGHDRAQLGLALAPTAGAEAS